MKSRLARASARCERRDGASEVVVDVKSGPSEVLCCIVCRYTNPADRRPPTVAEQASSRGSSDPSTLHHPRPIQTNTAECTALSPQKSRRPPKRDSRYLSLAISPSQPSRIECSRNRSE